MADQLTPEQIRQVKLIACEEAEMVWRHNMANLQIGTAEGEPRQTTQRNIWTLWEFAADYRTPLAGSIRKWVFDRFNEWDTADQRKLREHLEASRDRSEKWRDGVQKIVWGVGSAVLVAAAMAIYSHAGVIFGGK